jgi:hypothetical protein
LISALGSNFLYGSVIRVKLYHHWKKTLPYQAILPVYFGGLRDIIGGIHHPGQVTTARLVTFSPMVSRTIAGIFCSQFAMRGQ